MNLEGIKKQPIFGYWDLRGLGQSIKFMLKYLAIDFDEKVYKFGQNNSTDDWIKDKFNLDLDFPNLPYYIDGEIKLTQSKTIMKFLARNHGLTGQTESENIRIDMVEGHFEDFRNSFRKVVYCTRIDPNLNYEQLSQEYLSTLSQKLQEISDFLGNNHWFAGDRLTFIDFWTYEILDWNRHFSPKCFSQFKNLEKYLQRFENLPRIKEYIESGEFKRFPIFAPYAKWGGGQMK